MSGHASKSRIGFSPSPLPARPFDHQAHPLTYAQTGRHTHPYTYPTLTLNPETTPSLSSLQLSLLKAASFLHKYTVCLLFISQANAMTLSLSTTAANYNLISCTHTHTFIRLIARRACGKPTTLYTTHLLPPTSAASRTYVHRHRFLEPKPRAATRYRISNLPRPLFSWTRRLRPRVSSGRARPTATPKRTSQPCLPGSLRRGWCPAGEPGIGVQQGRRLGGIPEGDCPLRGAGPLRDAPEAAPARRERAPGEEGGRDLW